MRKRRRQNGVWLPPDPYNAVGNSDVTPISATDQPIIKVGGFSADNVAGISTTVDIPLVGDFNQDRIVGESNLPQGATLADSRFGYSLKRIVGKIWVAVDQFDFEADTTSHWVITAGIIVRRTDDVGDPLTIQTSTQSYDAAGDPWIWRRSWLLTNQIQALAPTGNTYWAGFPGFPQNNVAGLPSALDGPHVDAKTRRTIKQEERLYLHITALPLSGTNEPTYNTNILWAFDLRFFGRIFQSAGNRRNAVR